MWLKAFGQHLWRHFLEDRCFEAAGSLGYKTLIALVPLLAVMIGLVSSFGVFDDWFGRVESYVFAHFVPAKGEEIQAYVHQFIDRTSGLTASGSVLLIVMAILLMGTIERSFNRIWRVRRPRAVLNRVVMYWAALTLGPVLLGASLALSSYFAFLSAFAPASVQYAIESLLAMLAPFLIAWVAFFLMFLIIPHRRVYVRHAVAGALVSALLFEGAKALFVLYLGSSTTYQHLYGALATIPIFLLWIYVLWVVVLLGASLTAALTTFNIGQLSQSWTKRNEFVLLMRLLGHLWHAQAKGQSMSADALNAKEPAATSQQIQSLLEHLEKNHFVQFGENNQVILATDLAERSVADLYQSGEFVLPMDGFDHGLTQDPMHSSIIDFFQSLAQELGSMSKPIKEVVAPPSKERT